MYSNDTPVASRNSCRVFVAAKYQRLSSRRPCADTCSSRMSSRRAEAKNCWMAIRMSSVRPLRTTSTSKPQTAGSVSTARSPYRSASAPGSGRKRGSSYRPLAMISARLATR